jgi:sigma-E factor negative regulatory protein RseC
MIEERARVVAKSEIHAWTETERRTGCNACTVSNGCGTGAINNYLIKKIIIVKAFNPIGAEVGDMVIVGIPEEAFLLGSFVLYTMPLLAMFIGAGLGEILAQYFGGGEDLVILLGLGGLSGGLLGTRYIRTGGGLEPRILRTVVAKAMMENKVYPPKILS